MGNVDTMETKIETEEMSAQEQTIFDRIWSKIEGRIADVFHPPQADGAFAVHKDLNGKWRWIATFTNNFKDRDGEIISEQALDGYLDRVTMGLVPMPELWLGHIDGTKHGQADLMFGAGNFLTAVGSFDDTPDAGRALEYYRKQASKVALSHGFTFPSWGLKNGIYEVVNTFEISVLPPPLVASNPFTEFEVNAMKQISPEQKAALALAFGAEKADAIVQAREAQSEDIKAAGVVFKDFADVAEVVETPAVTEETETPVADTNKPVAELLEALIESQGELLSALTAQGKAIKALETTRTAEKTAQDSAVAALKSEVEALRGELGNTPRRASESAATVIDKKQAESIMGQPPVENDPFWKV